MLQLGQQRSSRKAGGTPEPRLRARGWTPRQGVDSSPLPQPQNASPVRAFQPSDSSQKGPPRPGSRHAPSDTPQSGPMFPQPYTHTHMHPSPGTCSSPHTSVAKTEDPGYPGPALPSCSPCPTAPVCWLTHGHRAQPPFPALGTPCPSSPSAPELPQQRPRPGGRQKEPSGASLGGQRG